MPMSTKLFVTRTSWSLQSSSEICSF